MTHDELLVKIYEIHNDSSDAGQETNKQYKGMIKFMQALSAVLQIKDRPRYSDTEADMWRSEAWNQALFVVREVIAKELK